LKASKGRKFRRFHKSNLEPLLCACGCGRFASVGRSFIQGHNGFNLTEEQEMRRRKAISVSMKGKPCSEHRRQKLLEYFKDPENRMKISETQKRLHQAHPEWFDNYAKASKMRRAGLLPSGMKGKKKSLETKIKHSIATKRNWGNTEYAKKVFHRRSMSGPETTFQKEYVEKYALSYFFNGNASNKNPLIIGRKIPDFVHETKNKLIEIWGDFFHKEQNPNDRISFFKDRGYDCLVIWASELINREVIMNRIKIFEGEV
jgi:very-short-patch-repair endonuclease